MAVAVILALAAPAFAQDPAPTPDAPVAPAAPDAPATPDEPAAEAIPASADATVGTDSEASETSETLVKANAQAKTGWKEKFRGSSVTLSTEVGQATFVGNEYADNPYIGNSVSFNPIYQLAAKQRLSLAFAFSYEYTLPDNDEGRRFSPGNTSLGYTYTSIAKFAKINLSGSASLALPTSFESQFNGTIFNLALGPTLSRAFLGDKLSLSWASRFTKYVPTSPNRGLRSGDDNTAEGSPAPGETPNFASAYCRDGANFCSGGSLNADFGFSNTVSVGYSFTDKWSASMYLGVTNIFKYEVPAEFSDPNLPRRGRSDSTSGGMSASYQLTPRYSLSGGFDTSGAALNPDQSFRFPLYDFTTPANGYTQYSVSLTASF